MLYLSLCSDWRRGQLGLDPRRNSELRCSYELDCVPVKESHVHTYTERVILWLKHIKTYSGFRFHLG